MNMKPLESLFKLGKLKEDENRIIKIHLHATSSVRANIKVLKREFPNTKDDQSFYVEKKTIDQIIDSRDETRKKSHLNYSTYVRELLEKEGFCL